MRSLISALNSALWGAPALIMILAVGLCLTVCLGFPQFTLFPRAMASFWRKLFPGRSEESRSSFQALCTALGATVGTGNLVGVAGAICLGGPGAVFWMWICGLLGMATKFAEAVLAVRYRVKQQDGYTGGPMYAMKAGLGNRCRWFAGAYCVFGVVAAFGVGNMAQINAVVTGCNSVLLYFGRQETMRSNLLLGILLAVLVGAMLLGGARRIGMLAERMVPFLAVGYILLCAGVLMVKAREIPAAFSTIFRGAVAPRAVTGGMLGSAFQALRIGCSRGVFTNEAGMGTASIAHASADVEHPAEQGLMGIMEVFLDTILICTLTALVILVSGADIPFGTDQGAALANAAFGAVYGGFAPVFLALALIFFALATILGWGLYGARCAEFLFGRKAWRYFAFAQTAAVLPGAVLDTSLVWQLSETVNGLMVIPNLILLAAMLPELRRLTIEFRKKAGMNYADFH